MTKNVFRICSVLAMGLASSAMILAAEESPGPEGVWDVSVTVKDCSKGTLIRVVRSLQMFHRDGSVTETANTASRGISEGPWTHAGDDNYNASYWSFRFKPDGTFVVCKGCRRNYAQPGRRSTQFRGHGTGL